MLLAYVQRSVVALPNNATNFPRICWRRMCSARCCCWWHDETTLLISGMGLVAVRVGAEAAAAAAARQHTTPQRKGNAKNGDGAHLPSSLTRKAAAGSRQSLQRKRSSKGPKKVRFTLGDDNEPKQRVQGADAKAIRQQTGVEAGDEKGDETGDDEALESEGERSTARTISNQGIFALACLLAGTSVNEWAT
jgi:hypothetical protein